MIRVLIAEDQAGAPPQARAPQGLEHAIERILHGARAAETPTDGATEPLRRSVAWRRA